MTAQPSNQQEPLSLRQREVLQGVRLSEWDKYSIIEVEKGRSERPLTEAFNLISAGQRHSNYTTVSSSLPPIYGGFIMSDSLKHCSKCDQFLELSFFNKNKQSKDGLTYWCKLCSRAKYKNYYKNNLEKVSARNKSYVQEHKEEIYRNNNRYYHENKEKSKTYRFENRDKILTRLHNYKFRNRELLRARRMERYRKNPDYFLAILSRRKAKKKGNGGSHTFSEWQYVKEVNGNRCLKCGLAEPEVKLTKDHIVPISRGGTDNIGNLQPLCLTCNIIKFTKTEDYRGRRLVRGKLRKSD